MCGIIGYIGFRKTKDVLLEGLQRLDYRGYDSAGVGIISDELQVFKEVGEIPNLIKEMPQVNGNIGIGHTRWATHGAVTKCNAHPHISSNQKIAVVHNGIIENFTELKEGLITKGYTFVSDTDSEVLSHLIEDHYKGNLEEAVYDTLQQIKGYYSIVVISADEPDKIVGARFQSPLVIGTGDNENFIASDIPALLKYTNRVIYLDEKQLCVITKKSIQVFDEHKKEVTKKEDVIDWTVADAEKSGFPHFMLKEIFDQPNAINHVLRGRVSEIDQSIIFPEHIEKLLSNGTDSVHIVACGTSYYAALAGKYIIEQICKIPVIVETASEYRFFSTRNTTSLVIFITQSGETSDTLAALREAKNSDCKTLAITNVIGSTATRIADGYILTQCGPEIGVAATKTFTSQIITLLLLALKTASLKHILGPNDIYNYILQLKKLPREVREVLDKSNEILDIAKKIKDAQSAFFIGRGINYPLSLEGALKLKEISYIHAEGFAAGELKHGPFALLTKKTPVIAIVSMDSTYQKMLANIGEIKARGSQVIAIADKQDNEIEKHADFVVRYPTNPTNLCCISISVILQLLAYHVANLRKCSIDKPRNLAKSVTVE